MVVFNYWACFVFFYLIATLWFELCLRVITVKCSDVNIQQVMCNGGIININMQNDGTCDFLLYFQFFSCLLMICMNKSFRHLHWSAFLFSSIHFYWTHQTHFAESVMTPVKSICHSKWASNSPDEKYSSNSWGFIKSSKASWRKLHFLPHHSGHLNSNNYVWRCSSLSKTSFILAKKSQHLKVLQGN